MLNNENVKNLFESLMSEIDLDEEREILIENEVKFNEDDLKSFHEKKNELLKVLKENKKSLEKLDSDDMSNISGGGVISYVANGVVSAFFNLFHSNDWRTALSKGGEALAQAMLRDLLAIALINIGFRDEDILDSVQSLLGLT